MRVSMARLKGVAPRPTRALLFKLGELAGERREAPDKTELPKVRLDTLQGYSYEGAVLAVDERPGGTLSVLLEQDGERAGAGRVLTYLDLVEPFHITVFGAEEWLSLLRFGAITRPTSDAPISPLVLRRLLEAAKQRFSSAFGLEFAVSDDLVGETSQANNLVRDVVDALSDYVAKTRLDPAGAEALKDVRKVLVRLGDGALVAAKKGDAVEVGLDPREGMQASGELFELLDRAL